MSEQEKHDENESSREERIKTRMENDLKRAEEISQHPLLKEIEAASRARSEGIADKWELSLELIGMLAKSIIKLNGSIMDLKDTIDRQGENQALIIAIDEARKAVDRLMEVVKWKES